METIKFEKLKIIFVTGGVVSSLGKGIVSSILGGLLTNCGYKVKIKKIDPYLNVDPGTLSPIEHGEVFVTNDGIETDLDLGHYERLGEVLTSKDDYITSGLIYNKIILKERKGEYAGKTVQVIPHFTNELKEAVFKGAEDFDFLICEVGGTVGDMESNAILETIRQIKMTHDKVLNIHVALLPYLRKAKEWKTKTVQHSVRTLLEKGISPEILLCRMEERIHEDWKKKIELLSNIKADCIFEALDASTIYHAMKEYENEGICKKVLELFKLPNKKPNLNYLYDYIDKWDLNFEHVNIGIIGKYTKCKDAYISLEESLNHACFVNHVKLNLSIIDSEKYELDLLRNLDGIIVPGGFGSRAIEGKINAINYTRVHNIPFLGICLGMQLAIIEGLREIYSDATSSEFNFDTKNPVILKLDEWYKEQQIIKLGELVGGSMRLGAYPCKLIKDSMVYSLYKNEVIFERHRHRYIFNKNYLNDLEKVGIKVVGTTIDKDNFVEIIERPDMKFFIATQFHSEFNSTIKSPHPLFIGFIKAAKENSII